jgi:hypothetical protein
MYEYGNQSKVKSLCVLFLIFFLQGLSIGTVNKIFLQFPYRWWPDHYTLFSVLKTNESAPCVGEVSNETLSQEARQVSLNRELFYMDTLSHMLSSDILCCVFLLKW